ncbi:MAG: hypothetical protein WBF49_08620, partial [Methyloceanibacter sp.]
QSTLIVTMPNGLRWGLLWHFGVKQRLPKIVQVRHHDAHAATFYVSPFEEATILVMDGYGDETAQSAYTGAGNRVERVARPLVRNAGRTSRLATDIAISRSRSSTQLRKPSFTSFARCRNGTRVAISACSAVSR